MKKFHLLLVTALIPVMAAGCSADDPHVISYTSDCSIPGRESFELKDEFVYYDSMFAELDENEFSYDLAKMGTLAAEDSKKNKLEGEGVKKTEEGNIFTQLGFENTKEVVLNADDYDEDKADLTKFFISNKKFTYEDEKYQVFSVGIVGSRGTLDFASNFDIGVNNPNYVIDENSHKDWVHRDCHKGFDVTSKRVIKKIDEYLSQYQNKDYKTIMFISGHSRGAAIADLVGKEFTDRKIKTFAYCIAAPGTVETSVDVKYENIFAVENKNDIVPYLPPEECGFTNYGIRREVALEDYEETWKEMCPKYEYQHTDVDAFKDFLIDTIKDRETAYAVPKEFEECEAQVFKTEQEAKTEHDKFASLFKEGTLEHLHTAISEVSKNEDEEYEFSLTAAPALIIDVMQSILSGKGNFMEILLNAAPFITRYTPNAIELALKILDIDLVPSIMMSHLCSGYLILIKAMEDNNQ